MSHEINVVSRTQIINVEPSSSSVSVINAGPSGPQGVAELCVVEVLLSQPTGDALSPATTVSIYRISSLLNGRDLVSVSAALTTPSSSGVVTVDVNRDRSGSVVSMLSTKLTIDENENDSLTAATPAVVDTANDDVQTGDHILFDIDTSGTNAKGLLVELVFS